MTLALGGALAVVAAVAAAPAATAQDTGTVYVVHGIPDTPVDVYVDGERALDDFQPGSSEGPGWRSGTRRPHRPSTCWATVRR